MTKDSVVYNNVPGVFKVLKINCLSVLIIMGQHFHSQADCKTCMKFKVSAVEAVEPTNIYIFKWLSRN